MPTVDILMGTYNGARHLDQQIESLVNQTHQNWRLLVRDDGSSDSTRACLAAWCRRDNRIELIEDDRGNLGFNRNFHLLLQHGTAPYVMFCDQDDWWQPPKIERTLAAMREQELRTPGLPVLVHSDATVTDGQLQPVTNRFVRHLAHHGYGLPSVLFVNPVQGSTLMMNRALQGLLARAEPVTHYDFQAALVAEATGTRVFLDESLMLYRQHGGNALGATSAPTPRPPQPRNKLGLRWPDMGSFSVGLGLLAKVEATLSPVRDAWHPCTEHVLQRHRQFVAKGFSIRKAAWLLRTPYRFYARRDHLCAWLWALGLAA